jgi:hypothetical protein
MSCNALVASVEQCTHTHRQVETLKTESQKLIEKTEQSVDDILRAHIELCRQNVESMSTGKKLMCIVSGLYSLTIAYFFNYHKYQLATRALKIAMQTEQNRSAA